MTSHRHAPVRDVDLDDADPEHGRRVARAGGRPVTERHAHSGQQLGSRERLGHGIYRFSTWVPDVVPPTGLTFNQSLVDSDEPLLFHTGPKAMFPLVSEAISRVRPVQDLRWVTFGQLESDECGSMNQFLDAAPRAEVAHGAFGCEVSFKDLCDRPRVPWPTAR